MNETNNETNHFGPVIHSYTRRQAIEDGFQVDVSSDAREAGIRFPTYLTRTVFDSCVTVPDGVEGQDEKGRLCDILWMLRLAIRKSAADSDRIPFELYVRNDNRKPKLTELFAVCSAKDIDDPRPAITIMFPGED